MPNNLKSSNVLSKTRKRGQMNRIGGAVVLGLSIFAGGAVVGSRAAYAQETTGRVTGRVTDQNTNAPMGGVTVIVQGPQGEDATVTDDKGQYHFTSLPVGKYVLRFYVANTSTQVEQPDVSVSAEKTVRVNVKIAATAAQAAQQTYVITGKPPTVDVGSARQGATFGENFMLNVPMSPNFGAVIAKAPGAFVDPSGNVSIGGSTGLENQYIVNSLNVTGSRYGNLNAEGTSSFGGGTNLPVEFLNQVDVNTGGYQAEFGGATGGVVNVVLKSGTNEFHGSVFASYAPYWMSADPKVVTVVGSAIAGVRRPDFDDRIGFEIGGPLIKDKLFFWAGLAPQIVDTHVHRLVYAQGMPDAMGNQTSTLLPQDTQRLNETHRTYNYAATVTYIPAPAHKLDFSAFGTPSFNNQLRSFNNGQELNSAFPVNGPSWAQESLTKSNTDFMAHWTSKLFDRKWQVEALGGLHNEYYYDRSPSAALNGLNQLQYYGSNLWDLEHLPGCEPLADGTQPCPVNPSYQAGGFGQVSKYTANRWVGELRSTHNFEAGGHHELKYGWNLQYGTLDLDRYYSGPPGQHALAILSPNGGNPDGTPYPHVNTQSFFRLPAGQYPTDFGFDPATSRFPVSDLALPPYYQDQLKADVKNIVNAFYLQDSYSPSVLRNLTVGLGGRLELQRLYDMNGNPFLDANNIAPRVTAVYDPFSDGKSKISAAYGRYYESIPMDIAARYFGGENFVFRNGIPFSACGQTNPYAWTGAGEYANCPQPMRGKFNDPNNPTDPASYAPINNSAEVQPHLKGQYQNEVVATLERQVTEDMTVRLDYTHRWIGTVIEDGYGNDINSRTVVANPGNVPAEALNDAMNDRDRLAANAKALGEQAMMDPTNAQLASQAADAQSKADNAKAKYQTLQDLSKAPKPERTYDALTLSANKSFSKNWLVHASYTYSRLVGNYEGLYQVQQNYFAPNGSNAYDTPDLYVNSRGPLPNDHPHQGRVDGYYSLPVGPGKVTFGLSFSGRSGMPKNYISQLIGGNQLVYMLPRGSGGRTPAIWQFDGHLAYNQKVQKDVSLEAYVDLFNIFDQQAALVADDNYTYDLAAPIVNGSVSDLKYAKNAFGQPITVNKNFGRPIVYQAPFYTRLGLRLLF